MTGRRNAARLFWWSAATFGLYLASASLVGLRTGHSIGHVTLTPEVGAAGWSPAALLFGLTGVAVALIVPGLPWALAAARGRSRTADLFIRAFVINLGQAVLFVSLWKVAQGSAPPRLVFLIWQALVAGSGLALVGWRRGQGRVDGNSLRPTLLIGAVVLVLLPSAMWGRTFVEDRSGDGTEAFEFSRSLQTRVLPYWDLENGHYGFYPQFVLFAYPAHLSFLLVGETEAGQRLPVFFYVFGAALIVAELARRRRRVLTWAETGLLAGAAVCFVLYHGEISTYEVVSDLAEPFGVDAFFSFLAIAAGYALVTQQRIWWGVLATLACLALSAGLPFAALLIVAGVATDRWTGGAIRWPGHLRSAAAFAAPWIVTQLLVSWYTTVHPIGTTKWSFSTVFDRYPLRFDPVAIATVIDGLAWAVALFPLLALSFMAVRERVTRQFGLVVVGYAAFLMVFGRTHPHYLIPLTFFLLVCFHRALASARLGRSVRLVSQAAYACALVGVAFLVWPREAPHTAYREFGAKTLMLYDSYPGVVAAARDALTLKPELTQHLSEGKPLSGRPPLDPATLRGLSHHLWISYSDTAPLPGRHYAQVLAAPRLAPVDMTGFLRRDLADGWVLFFRPDSVFAPAQAARH